MLEHEHFQTFREGLWWSVEVVQHGVSVPTTYEPYYVSIDSINIFSMELTAQIESIPTSSRLKPTFEQSILTASCIHLVISVLRTEDQRSF